MIPDYLIKAPETTACLESLAVIVLPTLPKQIDALPTPANMPFADINDANYVITNEVNEVNKVYKPQSLTELFEPNPIDSPDFNLAVQPPAILASAYFTSIVMSISQLAVKLTVAKAN